MAGNKITGDRPTIDVVIPVFNGEKYIVAAVRSADNQTYQPKSIIVIDDGSTDSTVALLAAYSGSVPIKVIRQENKGLSAARNTGIQHSNSHYIAFLDADDEWDPAKLEEQVKVLVTSNCERLAVVYCNYCIFDDQGTVDSIGIEPELRGKIFESLLQGNRISGSGSSVLIKRECFDRVGLFDEKLRACEDWDMWLRLAAHYEFDFTPMTLVKIRRHAENMQKDKLFMFINSLTLYNKWCTQGNDNGHLNMWRNNIVYTIAEDLPGFKSLSFTKMILSPTTKKILFKRSSGCVELYLCQRLAVIVIIVLKRIFKIKEYA